MFGKPFVFCIAKVALLGALLLGAANVEAQVEYTYTGSPFTTADPPWAVGDEVSGSFTMGQVLPPFRPPSNISGQLIDFNFTDGVQTFTPANTTVCQFNISTDGAGNIKEWTIFLREAPTPMPGSPQGTLSSGGTAGVSGSDQVGEGPAEPGACDDFSLDLIAVSSAPGTWTSSRPPVANPTDYTYTGAPFVTADPPWMVGDQVTGSMSFAGPLPPFMPATEVAFALDDFSFSDGVHTFTPANTTVCGFQVSTDGAGNIRHWNVFLREAPTPPPGSPQRTLSSVGTAGGSGLDQAGEGPAGPGACDGFSLDLVALSAAPGSWTSSNPPVANPTEYTYTGAPFVSADPPWAVGAQVTGSMKLGNPLPPFMPPTDIAFALDDFSLSDGIQTRTVDNSTFCAFEIGTDGAGNINHWVISMRETPTPGMGLPQKTLSSFGFASGEGGDQADQGPAGAGPCDDFVATAVAISTEAGSWSSSAPPANVPAEYAYTGVAFSTADPPWTVGNQVTGTLRLAGPLPPEFPYTNIAFAIEDFSFSDGVQTRTPDNSTVCDFSVATDFEGNIQGWFVWLREAPTPMVGSPQRTLDSGGSFGGVGFDSVGEGPAGPGSCDGIILDLSASSSAQGSWVRQFSPGPARISVSKDFSDDNNAPVQVTLTCNTGLPLQQGATVSEGAPVNFVVVDFEPGTMECTVTEVVPDGYSASYQDGSISSLSCSWEQIETGQYFCTITNDLEQVEVEVAKVWLNDGPQHPAQNIASASWNCANVSLDGGPENGNATGQLQFFGNPGSDSFFLYPDWESGTTCSVTEIELPDGGTEVEQSDCQDLLVFPGVGASCTIFNTRLFEGIPTLSEYGLALLTLLMLGMGYLAMRRFT